MSIDPRHFVSGDVTRKAAVVFGVGGRRQGQDLFSGVAHEQLLPSDAKALAAVPGVPLRGVALEPSPVSVETLVLGSCPGKLQGVRNVLHYHRRVPCACAELLDHGPPPEAHCTPVSPPSQASLVTSSAAAPSRSWPMYRRASPCG